MTDNELPDTYFEDEEDCWQCGGTGIIAGCFEDTCSCTGDPDDPYSCCAPSMCDVCGEVKRDD